MGNSSCWKWEGPVNNKGYGKVRVGGRKVLAHRVAYERWWGQIGEGKQLDHVCGVRECVNPEHLEGVSCRENLLRSKKTWASRNRAKRRCIRGNEFDEKREQGR